LIVVVDGTTEIDLPNPGTYAVQQFHGRSMQVPLEYVIDATADKIHLYQTCSRGQQSVISTSSRLTFPPFITTTTLHLQSHSHLLSPPAPTKPEQTGRRAELTDRPIVVAAAAMMTSAGAENREAVPRVVSILSALLERVAERNDVVAAVERRIREEEDNDDQEQEDAKKTKRKAVSAFQGLTKPAISVGGYLERIFRFAGCSPSCYVVAYIYLDRFLRRRPALAVDSFNVHRLLITSVLTAVKFVDDMYVSLIIDRTSIRPVR
jgi:hypothetical protein